MNVDEVKTLHVRWYQLRHSSYGAPRARTGLMLVEDVGSLGVSHEGIDACRVKLHGRTEYSIYGPILVHYNLSDSIQFI
jgi:hypothetical protein